MDQFVEMRGKLEGSVENDAKRKLIGEIESKIVDLQAQLQSLAEQKNSSGSNNNFKFSPQGRDQGRGRGSYRDGRIPFRGSSRGGRRGRGRFVSRTLPNTSYKSPDAVSENPSSAPNDFVNTTQTDIVESIEEHENLSNNNGI